MSRTKGRTIGVATMKFRGEEEAVLPWDIRPDPLSGQRVQNSSNAPSCGREAGGRQEGRRKRMEADQSVAKYALHICGGARGGAGSLDFQCEGCISRPHGQSTTPKGKTKTLICFVNSKLCISFLKAIIRLKNRSTKRDSRRPQQCSNVEGNHRVLAVWQLEES